MQVFVNHNSDQGPNGHGYRREESVEIEPVVKRVLEAAREGKVAKADMALLKKEFARMAAAAPVIRAKADNPRLMKEIGAWVDAFEQLGRAGQHAVAALEENNTRDAVTQLVQATQALAAMDGISRRHNQEGQLYRSVVKTGSRVMTPAVNELADTVSKKFSPLLRALRPFPPSPWSRGQYGQGGTLL
ncbi:hypothetical protein ABFY27_01665 [Akkermansia massiliensis]